jgi:hypothetical protein
VTFLLYYSFNLVAEEPEDDGAAPAVDLGNRSAADWI